jgi:hypothetical protein
MQLALLVLLSGPSFTMTWAEENTDRLGDIPFAECFIRSAERYDVDVELAVAVAIIESSLNPDAVSSSDAIGVMQIKWPLTAEHLGITQRELLFDPCVNIDAGISYLKELLELNANSESGDPEVQALASYHLGPTTIANTETLPAQAVDYAKAVFKQRDTLLLDPAQSEPAETAANEEAAEVAAASANAETPQQSNLEAVDQTNTFTAQSPVFDQVEESKSVVESPQVPQNPCSTVDVRSLVLNTHNPTERGEKFALWLTETGVNCNELQLLTLRNNLPLWLGTALNSELLGAVEALLEEKYLQP